MWVFVFQMCSEQKNETKVAPKNRILDNFVFNLFIKMEFYVSYSAPKT